MKKLSISFLLTGMVFTLVFASGGCSKRKEEKLNESLYDEIASSSLVFYRGIDSTYTAAGGSPHGNFRLKFNTIAAAALTDIGRLPSGGTFPDGSLIVKEVMNGNTISLYAVMKKDKEAKFRSEGDWVWGEYNTDGTVKVSAGGKGEQCVSCHTGGTNRDYVRSFDLH